LRKTKGARIEDQRASVKGAAKEGVESSAAGSSREQLEKFDNVLTKYFIASVSLIGIHV
jgi:hypothetical protein